MSPPRHRVLVVDDSAFARKVLREILGGSSAIEVVGTARDGLEALEKIAELQPDVITLDMVMPNLDGMGVLAALADKPAPRVVVVSMSDSDSAQWAIVENVQREDLNPIDKALAFRALAEQFGMTQAEIAERVGVDRSTIANLVRLTELEPVLQ